MNDVELAETRLGVRFPDAYRTAAHDRVPSEGERWTLLALGATHRCKDARTESLRGHEGVVIGDDGGANTLLFLFAEGSSTDLADPVYLWDAAGLRLGRVTSSFDELLSQVRVNPERSEDAASVLLAFSDQLTGDEGSAPFWSNTRPSATVDEHARRAAKLVRELVESGLLVLVAPRTEPGVAAEAAAVLAMEEDDRITAEGLLETWVDRPDIAEVFASEDEVEALLRAGRG